MPEAVGTPTQPDAAAQNMGSPAQSEPMAHVFSPDGVKGQVPQSKLGEYIGTHGFENAVRVTSPEGNEGWLPQSKVPEYTKTHGFSIGQSAVRDVGKEPTSTLGKVASGVGTVAREIPLGAASAVGLPETTHASDFSAVPGLAQMVAHPIDSAKLVGKPIIDAHERELQRAAQAGKETGPAAGAEMMIHSAAAMVPVVGPAAVAAGEEIGQGLHLGEDKPVEWDKAAHGAGAGAGLVGSMAMGTKAGEHATNAAVEKTGRAVITSAERAAAVPGKIVQSARTMLNPAELGPVESTIKSLKPRNSIQNVKQQIQLALPDARRAADSLGVQVKTLDDGLAAVTHAKKQVWSEYQARLGPNAKATIDGNKIADAMESTITQRFEQKSPAAAERIRDLAKNYRRPMTLEQAEDFLQDANNELKAYYAKHRVNQRAAAADPDTGHVVAEANALREALYSKIDQMNGPGTALIKQRYGALNTMEDILRRRINVADRAAPDSLIEQIGKVKAAGGIAKGAAKIVTSPLYPPNALSGAADIYGAVKGMRAAKAARMANDSGELLRQAFDKTAPSPPVQPPRPPARLALPENTGAGIPLASSYPSNEVAPVTSGERVAASTQDARRMAGQRALPAGNPAEGASIQLGPTQPAATAVAPGEGAASVMHQMRNTKTPLALPERGTPIALPPSSASPNAEPLTMSEAHDYLRKANGDKAVARQMAAADGRITDASQAHAPGPAPAGTVPKPTTRGWPKVYGSASPVLTPNGQLAGRYRVMEADDLVPSHDALTFAKNPNYPEGVQERAYHTSLEAQNRVIQQAQNYMPDYTINNNPDAVNGPPVVTPEGIVLGGNSRTMSTQRLYAGAGGEAYRQALMSAARQFGIDPQSLAAFKKPVLVREVTAPGGIEGLRRVASDLNKSMTGALSGSERAVSAGKSVRDTSLAAIGSMLERAGESATLRDVLSRRGGEIVSMLTRDGVITERERPQFIDTATGGLNDAGKDFVEKALTGAVIDDPVLMDKTPKSILNKIHGSLGELAHLGSRPDEYNLMPLLRQALEDHADIAQRGTTVDLYLGQSDMFGSTRNAAVDAMTRALADNPKAVRTKLKQFTQDAKYDRPGQATLLGPKPSASKAFNDAFGTKFSDEEFAEWVLKALDKYSKGGGRR